MDGTSAPVTPVSETDRYRRKRVAIVSAAADIINHRGVKGMTLADVASHVGLITTSVTYYFKKKEDLAEACFQDAILRLDAVVSEALTEADPPARLHRFLDLYLQQSRSIREGLAPPLAGLSDIRALTEPHRTRALDSYANLFRKVRTLFQSPDLEWMSLRRATARTYLLMEQVFWLAAWLPRYDLEDYPRVRERMFDILINGLMAAGGTWAPKLLENWEPAAIDCTARSRDAFYLAATRLINRFGYRGVSVERISAELNVTKGSFYHHNDAKDDLVVACFERSFAMVRRAQSVAMSGPGDSWEKLSAVARTLVEHQLSEDGPLLRTSALSALPEAMRIRMVDASNRLSARFAAMISDGIAEGVVRPVDPMIAAQMMGATLNAAADLRDGPAGVTQEAIADLYAKPLLTGVFSR
ncbi:MAG TPA: TetR/AcrR family transcriptional regulator [Caulobacteraceae bacterium]|jgi:AcrR family transcriptional regulator